MYLHESQHALSTQQRSRAPGSPNKLKNKRRHTILKTQTQMCGVAPSAVALSWPYNNLKASATLERGATLMPVQARNTSRANCSGLSDSSEDEDAPAPEPALKVLPQCARHTARHRVKGHDGVKIGSVAGALVFGLLRSVCR